MTRKTHSEQVEIIKSLIRKNNYTNHQMVFEHCKEIGISLNFSSLTRFAQKLELLDQAQRAKQAKDVGFKDEPKAKQMTYEQAKKRETEITFELGELKLKENKLLTELDELSKLLGQK